MKNRERVMHGDGAQALQDHIEAFATRWIADWRSRTSVLDELLEVHKITNAALVLALRTWNRQHHALRALPPEIFEHCWSFLETPDLVRVAAVCSEWRSILHAAPVLWTSLDFVTQPHTAQVGRLLERSKGLRIGLSLHIKSEWHGEDISHMLKPHAHRLVRLELHDIRPGYTFRPITNLHLDAPVLHTFCSDAQYPMFDKDKIDLQCPALQRLCVEQLRLHKWERRFASVTALECTWSGASAKTLYDVFPRLESLHISREGSMFGDLPHLDLPRDSPPPATLQRVVLRDLPFSVEDAVDFGFTGVRVIEVHGLAIEETLPMLEGIGGKAHSIVLHNSQLIIHGDRTSAPGSPGRTFCLSFPVRCAFEQYLHFIGHPTLCENVTTLSLMVDRFALPVDEWKQHFFFPHHRFPALETLVLSVGHPLLDLTNIQKCGTLSAPMLRRIVIANPRLSRWGRVIEPVSPLSLAIFISWHVELGPGNKVEELVLDGEGGVRFTAMQEDPADDEFEVLQRHVEKISHRYRYKTGFDEMSAT